MTIGGRTSWFSMDVGSICVLGASGFIGSEIFLRLKEANKKVIGTTRQKHIKELICVDPSDTNRLKNILDSVSVVVNTMGSFKPVDFAKGPSVPFDTITELFGNLDSALVNTNVSKILHVSSAGTVYGENKGRLSREIDMPAPTTWYGRMKLFEETMIRAICEKHGIQCLIVRLSNPFGNKNVSNHGFIDVLSKSVIRNTLFKVYSSVECMRDFIHVADMAKVIERLIDANIFNDFDIFNVGSGKSVSLSNLALIVQDELGGVSFESNKNLGDLNVVNICTEKIKEAIEIDWKFTSPQDYISRIVEQAKRNRNA